MNEQPDPSWKKPEEPRGVQPFALVKYFSFTSLSVILVASFALTWIFSDNARDTMLDRSESYSRMFAENLNRQVFHSFVIPTPTNQT
ncbi:MAG: two-component sensor histidine kinase, partial [Candidatus Electrothrix sp. AUS4]|nr:two-component sensor histidine kinase [Candidatus Electrothrix sp. AUS4]